MSDPNTGDQPGTTAVASQPDLLAQGIASLVRHFLTLAAGYLGAHGLLAGNDQQTQFVSLGNSMVLAAIAYGWSYIQKRNAAKALTAAKTS